MKDFIYSEKFDKYLQGKLNTSEKTALDEEIRQDPLLNHEVNLQKDIYRALGNERRLLLKNRLDSVQLSTDVWLNLTGLQWAAIISAAVLISAGSYYYFERLTDDMTISAIDVSSVENNQSVKKVEAVPEVPIPSYRDEAATDSELSASVDVVPSPEVISSNTAEYPAAPVKETLIIPEIVRPHILSDFIEEDQQIVYSDFEAPDKTIFEKTEPSLAHIAVETVNNSGYDFHYKLVNQKLFLYGDFQGIPYKIIALNREDRKSLFLEYMGNYYSLKEIQSQIAPLTEINDSTVVKALRRLSN